MNTQPTIIKVRRGINNFKYSACDVNGYFIGNFKTLSDVRQHWLREIKWGQVVLVRELDKMPDMSKIEETKAIIDKALKSMVKNNERHVCKL